MISPEHQSVLNLTMLSAITLFAIIFAVIIFSQLKKNKVTKKQSTEEATQSQLQPITDKNNLHLKNQPQVQHEVKSELLSEDHGAIEKTIESEKKVIEAPTSMKAALAETKKSFLGRIKSLFTQESSDHLEQIEEVLYTSDLGPQTVQKLTGELHDKSNKNSTYEEICQILKHSMENMLVAAKSGDVGITLQESGPTVLMIVGVNGAGKTTSIGKISARYAQDGKKVLVAAGDTFRAAAGNQLKVWTERAQVEIFSPEGVTDPSAVAFDALSKGIAQKYDIIIIDTAGRLHTQANLMEEIKKMKRVMTKLMPEAPHETLIVLDANSGQNALMQAKEFNQALGLTGVILTKMDGTAKGGVAFGVAHELGLPIKLIGIGEKVSDLREFNRQEFIDSIFE